MNNLKAREDRVHSSSEKPFSYYKCIIPDFFGYVPMHWHEEFEINYILEGSAEFICGEEKFISQKGDIIITQPDTPHSIYPVNGSRQVYDTVVFSSEMLSFSESDRCYQQCIEPVIKGTAVIPSHITANHCYYNEIRLIIENIFSCAKGDAPHLDMLMRSELLRLIWLLQSEAERNEIPARETDAIRSAILYIQKNFREVITIKQLAEYVHLSPSYFMAQFRASVGFSAIEYISHYRINYICKEIADTKKSISEIAYDSGFRNLSNFNRQFFRIIGSTPTEYRKKQQMQMGFNEYHRRTEIIIDKN
ncbi:MAG: AraC family transcriptional regulator [Ruminococcus sp.]|nr:AraC family transcriptional regulator [Ruminococcus sp.]